MKIFEVGFSCFLKNCKSLCGCLLEINRCPLHIEIVIFMSKLKAVFEKLEMTKQVEQKSSSRRFALGSSKQKKNRRTKKSSRLLAHLKRLTILFQWFSSNRAGNKQVNGIVLSLAFKEMPNFTDLNKIISGNAAER